MAKTLSTKEVAKLFDVDVVTITNWVRKGKLPAIRKEGSQAYEFLEQDVLRFFETWKRPLSGRKRGSENWYNKIKE